MSDASLVVAAFVVAAPIAAFAHAWSVRFARLCGALDIPSGYKAHATPTPLLGGLSVAAGFAVAASLFAPRVLSANAAGAWALALGAGVIVAAGLYDDVVGLRPARKLGWQIGATILAGGLLAVLGVRLDLFLEWPSLPQSMLTLVWIVGVTNALNLLDNMNGLCAGIGAIAAAALAVLNHGFGDTTVAVLAAALSGACVGYLPFNYPRAQSFLGDTGSMLIGFSLAALSVMGVYTNGARIPELAVLAPLVVSTLPIVDVVVVVLLRRRVRARALRGDRLHDSHRLVRRRFGPPRAVALVWAMAAMCGAVAVALPSLRPVHTVLALAGLIAVLAGFFAMAGWRGLDDHAGS